MSGSHKRKAVAPKMMVGARSLATDTAETGGGRYLRTRREVHDDDAGGPSTVPPEYFEEDIATNMARAAEDFSWGLGDTSLQPEPDMDVLDGIAVVVTKPPRNANSDRPLKTWMAYEDEYVQMRLRREGRGAPKVYARCAGIRCVDTHVDPTKKCKNHICDGEALYRCHNGTYIGEVMRCAKCIVASHTQHPTHFVEKWNGKFFERSRMGLRDLGLRVQMGHPPGVVCSKRRAAAEDFVLYDVTGIHELNVDFCGCQPVKERREQCMAMSWFPATALSPNTCATFAALKLFQILNCLGKLSAYDFLRGLEMLTNHDGLHKPPDRRKPFMHIVRMWRESQRMMRFKRGHDASGVAGTEEGELTVLCRSCPQPRWNLDEDWDKVPWIYIYFLFLAQDANFRLVNRNVSTEEADPILGDGSGYFAKRGGPEGYKAHIAKNASEKEISSCSGFQAMFLANMKRVKGLRTTGIAGVTCARHNMWRPNGMGDLQVGERYCNLDYLLLSALLTFCMFAIVLSYDIACQYGINFWERMKKFPERMQLTISEENMWWKVPNFHLPAHKPPCHSPYSFHYMFGAGLNHGEGVEQNWSFSNGAAASTRLMGPGSRVATLEDVFGFHNYDRQLAMHRILPKRLADAIKEGTRHAAALRAFTEGLEAVRKDEVAEWRAWVGEWEGEQHTDPSKSPFEYKEAVTTLRDIQATLAQAEMIATSDGVEIEQESTPSTFITMGLAVEDAQRRLEIDRLGFTKRRTALLKRIHKFRQLQLIYMPTLRSFLTDLQRQVFDGNGEQLPEATRLFMPSEILRAEDREIACAPGLPQVEALMREGEAQEALEVVRQGLRSRTMTNRFKIKNHTGQGALTRGQGILRQINIKIHLAKIHYRYARAALAVLWKTGTWMESLKVLRDEDVRALNERTLVKEAQAGLDHLDDLAEAVATPAGVTVAEGLAAGETHHEVSWIWFTTQGKEDESDPKLHEALRVEWCKAYARSRRFEEEIRQLSHEMPRTIEFGYTAAAKWAVLAEDVLPDSSPELTEGRQAYAAEHVALELETCAFLTERWRAILRKAEEYLSGNAQVGGALVTVELEMGDELDPEDEEALLEADMAED
ncbi:hypothetical protein C8R43DRAFT_1122730 [Mycena crocata]|nr:hypothetical protein C8R43DRAFT_1122730 [Mycena crocata]